MQSGLDRNGNGVLDDSEVETTQYACDPSTTTLTRQDQLPPSLDCPAGGVAVQTGVDTNGDGTLQDSEIQQTVRTCNSTEIWNGDFAATEWSDPIKVAALRGARVVTGSLTIASSSPVSLPMLELVSGGLTAQTQTPSVSLPALVTVGGAMALDSADVDELSALQQVGGALGISSTGSQPSGAMMAAPLLRSVGGDLVLFSNGTLTMPELTTIGGGFVDEGSLSALDLRALTSIGNGLGAFDQTLGDFSLPALQTVSGLLEVDGAVKTVELPALTTIGGGLFIESMAPQLTALSLPALNKVSGGVVVVDVPQLATLDLGTLDEIDGVHVFEGISDAPLWIFEVPLLTTLRADHLRSVNGVDSTSLDGESIDIQVTGLSEISFPSLTTVDGDIGINDNPALQRVLLRSLTEATTLSVTNLNVVGVLDTISAPAIRNLGTLNIGDALFPGTPAHPVHTLDFSLLTQVSVALSLNSTGVNDLTGFSSLVSVGRLDIINDDRLHDFTGMTALQEVSNLDVEQNTALTSLDGLEHVTEVPGFAQISFNPAMTSVAGLRNLTSVGESLVVSANVTLPSIDWASLHTVGTELIVSELPATTSVSFSSLSSVGSLSIVDIPLMTSLAGFAQLAPVAGNVSLSGLTGVDPDELQALFHRLKPSSGGL